MKFVMATSNPGKMEEFEVLFKKLGHKIVGLEEVGFVGDILEDGGTFEENAFIKANTIMRFSGMAAVADDSGLEVDALDGAPGIYSARYSAPGTRKKRILDELKDVPYEGRGARFVCAIACVFPDGDRIVARGTCEGKIAFECRGENGFGYDPIFYIPRYDLTFAQMDADQKNSISHRARALENLADQLKGRER